MPYKDPEVQRAAQNTWMAKRRAAWLADHPCRCGQPAVSLVSSIPGGVAKGVWSWAEQRRDNALQSAVPLCANCYQRTKTPQAKNAATSSTRHEAADRQTVSTTVPGSAAPLPVPVGPAAVDDDRSAGRREWREQRRQALNYGYPGPHTETSPDKRVTVPPPIRSRRQVTCWSVTDEEERQQTLKEIAGMLADMDVADDHSDVYQAGVVLLAAIYVGPGVVPVRRLTGYAPAFVEWVAANLRRCGLWEDGGIMHYEWLTYAEEAKDTLMLVSFVSDCLAGAGHIDRSPAGYRRDPDSVWRRALRPPPLLALPAPAASEDQRTTTSERGSDRMTAEDDKIIADLARSYVEAADHSGRDHDYLECMEPASGDYDETGNYIGPTLTPCQACQIQATRWKNLTRAVDKEAMGIGAGGRWSGPDKRILATYDPPTTIPYRPVGTPVELADAQPGDVVIFEEGPDR